MWFNFRFCVGLTVLDLQKLGTYIIKEDTKPLGEESGKTMEKNLEKNGVKIISMKELEDVIKKKKRKLNFHKLLLNNKKRKRKILKY